ncbi:MAG TPA: YkgJ family cysteine cluster protein [Candidatus Limnocylindria bacterium]|nr:YkgJ family cysteine cluster protein [Candidatus Limnocylindria bacterium]
MTDRSPKSSTAVNDARDARALTSTENADLCAGCVKCCTYITVEIDAPRAAWEYDQWIWALYHQGVSLYVERPERWFVHFEAVCTRLDRAGRCAIHGRHPVLCREYDPRSCERRLPLAEIRAWFDDGDQLEAWIRVHRPAHHRRLLAYRKDTPQGPPVADVHAERGELVTIGDSGGSPRTSGWSLPRKRP